MCRPPPASDLGPTGSDSKVAPPAAPRPGGKPWEVLRLYEYASMPGENLRLYEGQRRDGTDFDKVRASGRRFRKGATRCLPCKLRPSLMNSRFPQSDQSAGKATADQSHPDSRPPPGVPTLPGVVPQHDAAVFFLTAEAAGFGMGDGDPRRGESQLAGTRVPVGWGPTFGSGPVNGVGRPRSPGH